VQLLQLSIVMTSFTLSVSVTYSHLLIVLARRLIVTMLLQVNVLLKPVAGVPSKVILQLPTKQSIDKAKVCHTKHRHGIGITRVACMQAPEYARVTVCSGGVH
jgi:hypothetical protein